MNGLQLRCSCLVRSSAQLHDVVGSGVLNYEKHEYHLLCLHIFRSAVRFMFVQHWKTWRRIEDTGSVYVPCRPLHCYLLTDEG